MKSCASSPSYKKFLSSELHSTKTKKLLLHTILILFPTSEGSASSPVEHSHLLLRHHQVHKLLKGSCSFSAQRAVTLLIQVRIDASGSLLVCLGMPRANASQLSILNCRCGLIILGMRAFNACQKSCLEFWNIYMHDLLL